MEDQQSEDPSAFKYTWTIKNFSSLNVKKHYTDVFTIGGFKWRLLIFPEGNDGDQLSLFLNVPDAAKLPYGWSRRVQFSLAVISHTHPKFSIRKETYHQFNCREDDWGFNSFIPLRELHDPSKGYLVNDTLIVDADVVILKADSGNQSSEDPSVFKSNDTASNAINQTSKDTPASRFTDIAATMEDEPSEDPPAFKHTWTIKNFSSLNVKKHCTDAFTIGGFKWRLLIFPEGNNVDQLSLFLNVPDAAKLPYGWSRRVQFSLAVISHTHPKFSIRKETYHQFNCREDDWGFNSFIPLRELHDPSKGYLVNDTLIVDADVVVLKADSENQSSEDPSVFKSKDTASNAVNQTSKDTPASRFTDIAGTMEDQPSEDPSAFKYTWTIKNFSCLNVKKHYTDVFTIGGFKWRLLIFPEGNNVDQLSLFLNVPDAAKLPYGWSRRVQFSLAVISHTHPKFSIRKETYHQFNCREDDWGFNSFIPLRELHDPSKGYLVDDTLTVEADVVLKADSNRKRGFVGLKQESMS